MHLIITSEKLEPHTETSTVILPPESFELLTKAIVTMAGLLITGVVAILTKRYISI